MKNISPEELQSLKAQAMMAEKGKERFSVRLSVTGGRLETRQLNTIADLAQRFGDGTVHLTTRQGVEIPHVPYENLTPLRTALDAAGLKLAAAGKCVRGIVACPGSSCVYGLIDSQSLAQKLHARVGSRNALPHKFKIAIAGCPNGCTKPKENDLGVQGRAGGFTVFVGGKMGKHPRWADVLPLQIQEEVQLFGVFDHVIDWYAAEGKPGERFGATIDRIGIEQLVQSISGAKRTEE
jgi:dissimilatory sulfite reductase (desulfoviridin) alpha/beta subunit